MPDLELWRWEEHAPMIGRNRELPEAERFTIRVKSGITRKELHAFLRKPGSKSLDEWHKSLKGLIEIGRNPPTVSGKKVATLKDLLELALEQSGGELAKELVGVIAWYNSVNGTRSFHYAPPVGEPTSTGGAGSTSGDGTKH